MSLGTIGVMALLAGEAPLVLEDIHIRDPFILPVAADGLYYLYGTAWQGPAPRGFLCWTSPDLRAWSEPRVVFRDPEGFTSLNHWAPEVHQRGGRYYLFATFWQGEGGPPRHTRVLVADRPDGPFTFHSEGGVTPPEWYALDGTLWEEDGRPWLVFCHEWVQTDDGTIDYLPLTTDLSAADGPPSTLFNGSDAPWGTGGQKDGRRTFVTDGPWLHRTAAGELLMLWSSFGAGGYKLAVARSESGTLSGPWAQQPEPIYGADGGHGMLFRRFDGHLMAALHAPNKGPLERARLLAVEELPGSLKLTPWPAE